MAALIRGLRRHYLSIAMGGLLLGILSSCLLGPQGPFDLLALSRHRSELAEKNAALATQNAELQHKVAKLQSDPFFLQKLVREELGYARPDEFIYRFPVKQSQ